MPEERGRAVIKTYTCSCGWFRQWNEDYRGDRVIDHPIYGIQKARDVAVLDIRNHICATALEASLRAKRRFGYREDGDASFLPTPIYGTPMEADLLG